MTISDEERARRAEAARRSRHSAEMEGGYVPAETQADQDAYVRGEIDEAEMVRRFRERYGLSG